MKKQNIVDLVIGPALDNPKNIYRIHCEFMFGDADGHETVLSDIPEEDKNEAINIVQVISDCIFRNRYGSGGFEQNSELIEWYNVDNFTKYITNCDGSSLLDDYQDHNCGADEEAYSAHFNLAKYTIEMAMDQNCFYGSFRSFHVTYFDSNGLEHSVGIKRG